MALKHKNGQSQYVFPFIQHATSFHHTRWRNNASSFLQKDERSLRPVGSAASLCLDVETLHLETLHLGQGREGRGAAMAASGTGSGSAPPDAAHRQSLGECPTSPSISGATDTAWKSADRADAEGDPPSGRRSECPPQGRERKLLSSRTEVRWPASLTSGPPPPQ